MLAVLVSTMMANYYNESAGDELTEASSAAKHFFEQRLKDEKKTVDEFVSNYSDEVKAYVSAPSKFNRDITMILFNAEGKVKVYNVQGSLNIQGYVLPTHMQESLAEGSYIEHGNLNGLLANDYYVKGVALTVDGEIEGYVFACVASERINNLMRTTVKAMIMTCLWVMLAALIAVYFISDRIISPLKGMSGAAKAFAAGRLDVRVPVKGRDEISELAIAFNDMAASLANIENTRSTFLSSVSHDLRTPMTTISGFIDGILDGTIPKEKHEYYLRMIGDEIRRLSRLVAALLDVTRIQAGERKFTMRAFDICEMARVILISFEQKIDKKRLDVEFDVDEENMLVNADRDAIYQILYNICDNALKFSREGGKYRIKITEKSRKVFVSVYNEGEGIRSDELPRVFDRFFKTDKSRGLDKTGVGLGLYISKSIIDAHNEEIWVKSKYGEYCEFIFTLSKANEAQIKKSLQEENESKS
jgi:signal transduction histidine kinase